MLRIWVPHVCWLCTHSCYIATCSSLWACTIQCVGTATCFVQAYSHEWFNLYIVHCCMPYAIEHHHPIYSNLHILYCSYCTLCIPACLVPLPPLLLPPHPLCILYCTCGHWCCFHTVCCIIVMHQLIGKTLEIGLLAIFCRIDNLYLWVHRCQQLIIWQHLFMKPVENMAKVKKCIAVLHETCRNWVRFKHWIGYQY